MKQSSFELNLGTRRTRKQAFLRQMDAMVAWAALVELLTPFYSEGRNDRPPFALETMLRVHFMEQWFSLSDPAMEEALVNTLRGTSGNVADVTEGNSLLHGQEKDVFGDAGYQGAGKRPNAKASHQWHVAMRPGKRKKLDKDNKLSGALIDQVEKILVGIRAKEERPFRVINCQFGFTKVRCRGLKKNTLQLKTLFALSNLWRVRHKLMGAQA